MPSFIEITPDTKISSTKLIREGAVVFHNLRLLCILLQGHSKPYGIFFKKLFLSHFYFKDLEGDNMSALGWRNLKDSLENILTSFLNEMLSHSAMVP